MLSVGVAGHHPRRATQPLIAQVLPYGIDLNRCANGVKHLVQPRQVMLDRCEYLVRFFFQEYFLCSPFELISRRIFIVPPLFQAANKCMVFVFFPGSLHNRPATMREE